MRYLAWALVGLMSLSGCSSPAVRYHDENQKAVTDLKGEPGLYERKLLAVKIMFREEFGLELTDAQAKQFTYALEMRQAGKMTEAEALAFLGADEPMPYPPSFYAPQMIAPFPSYQPPATGTNMRLYNFSNGRSVTCFEGQFATNCF